MRQVSLKSRKATNCWVAVERHSHSNQVTLARQKLGGPISLSRGKDVQVYLYKTFLGKDVQVYLYKTFLGKDVQVYLYKSTETRFTNKASFEYHAIMVTAPVKTYVIVIYRPPGPHVEFIHELDTLLSSIPEQECPTLILGDMNIHLDNPNSANFRTLVHSFDLQQVPTPPTHKAGKELDL